MIDLVADVPYYYRGAHEARFKNKEIFNFNNNQLEVALDTD